MGGIRWNHSHLFQISDSCISPLFDLFLFLWTLEMVVMSFERPRIVWMESYFAHKIRWDRELWGSTHENRFHVLIVIFAERINWPLENISYHTLICNHQRNGFFLVTVRRKGKSQHQNSHLSACQLIITPQPHSTSSCYPTYRIRERK